MKKLTIALISAILFILVAIFAIIFTPYGSNTILKPIINSQIQQKIKKPKIEVTKFDSKPNYINLDAKIENSIDFNTHGNLNYFKKSFNLDYSAKAKSLQIQDRVLKPNLKITGKAVGDIDSFKLIGNGSTFDSNISYETIVKNREPKAIKAKIKDAKISELLALAGQPAIISGIANVDIFMPSLDMNNPSGKALIEIKDGVIDAKKLRRYYKINLYNNESLKAKIVANAVKNYIVGKGQILTTSAKLTLNKFTATPNFKAIKGYFSLDIPNLSRLNSLAKMQLKGKLRANGAFYANLDKKLYQANIKTKSFGGLAKVKYNSNSAKVVLKNVSIVKILKTLSQPYFVTSGLISGVVDIPNLKKLNGSFNISSSGKVNRRLFKMKLPSYKYKLKTKGSLKNGKIFAKSSYLNTSFVKVYLANTNFTILTKALTSDFRVKIDNLKALKAFINQDLRGALDLNGKVKYAKGIFSVNGLTKSLGGSLQFVYNNNSANVKFKNIETTKILYMLNMPQYISKGFATGSIKLTNLNPISGIISIASNGIINNSVVNKLYNLKLNRKIKYIFKMQDATIRDNLLRAKPTIKSTLANVEFSKFLYNIKSGVLSAKYILNIPNLASIGEIVNTPLQGSLRVDGEIKKRGKNLIVSGVTNKFHGTTNFMLNGDRFTLNGAGINLIELLDMLKKPRDYDGVAKIDLNYNLKRKYGTFKVTVNELKILNSKFINAVQKFFNIDISKEVFKETNIDGVINNNLITFNLNTNSRKVKIVINNGKVNTKDSTIDAKVKITLNGKDYYFRIKGKTSDPHYQILFKGAVKDKVLDIAKKKIFKKLGVDSNETNLKTDALKSGKERVKKVREKAKEKIEQKIEKVVPKDVKGLLNNLFK